MEDEEIIIKSQQVIIKCDELESKVIHKTLNKINLLNLLTSWAFLLILNISGDKIWIIPALCFGISSLFVGLATLIFYFPIQKRLIKFLNKFTNKIAEKINN